MAEQIPSDSESESPKNERKELQAKIQKIKRAIPKRDKRKRKELLTFIGILESQLKAKPAKETGATTSKCQEKSETLDSEILPESRSELQSTTSQSKDQKISRAKKRRDKKANKAKEREANILQQESENLLGARHIESEKINKILFSRGLLLHEVSSDGDCLFRAISHQLSVLKLQEVSVRQLRQITRDYMLDHIDDFLPFLTSPVTGNFMDNDEYKNYCDDIANSPTWGGQIELKALSHIYSVPIEVIQANGPSIIVGENYPSPKLILSYHRHMYGLGEHYNSVVKKADDDESLVKLVEDIKIS